MGGISLPSPAPRGVAGPRCRTRPGGGTPVGPRTGVTQGRRRRRLPGSPVRL